MIGDDESHWPNIHWGGGTGQTPKTSTLKYQIDRQLFNTITLYYIIAYIIQPILLYTTPTH